MLRKVKGYIASNQLLDKRGKYIVALSGGADSVCLLLVMKALGYSVEAAHCNFRLRGEESDRDENFCRDLCESDAIPFHLIHFDTKEYAALHKISIEMAARNLRYSYFESLCRDIDASGICVAHHRDDNVETILLNIIRGTGIQGLTGIHPVNGRIIRPLLCVSREEIIDYLDSISQPYVSDSTNLVNDVKRNKIRLDVLPLLEQLNPSVRESISNMAQWVNDAVAITHSAVAKRLDEISFSPQCASAAIGLKALKQSVSPQYVLYRWLSENGFTSSLINSLPSLEDMRVGQTWKCGEKVLAVDRDSLIVGEFVDTSYRLRVPEEGKYIINDESFISFEKMQKADDFAIDRHRSTATLDADKVRFPLTFRHYADGESFSPFGMKGRKLISDYLTDRKKNPFQRNRQMVLCDADGNILWLVNERPDNRYCVTDKTINVLVVRYKDKEESM